MNSSVVLSRLGDESNKAEGEYQKPAILLNSSVGSWIAVRATIDFPPLWHLKRVRADRLHEFILYVKAKMRTEDDQGLYLYYVVYKIL